MNATRHALVISVFEGALELQGIKQTTYLDQSCGDDHELRSEVEQLLAYDDAGDDAFSDADEDGAGLVGAILGQPMGSRDAKAQPTPTPTATSTATATGARACHSARGHRVTFIGAIVAVSALTAGLLTAVVIAIVARNHAAELRWTVYRSTMSHAAFAISRGETQAARDAINAAPAEMHGWERDHLRARATSDEVRHPPPAGCIWSDVCWPPGGIPLATAHGDGKLHVVNALTGESVRVFATEEKLGPPSIAPDGSRVTSHELPTGIAHVWEVAGDGHRTESVESTDNAVISNDGRRVASATFNDLRVSAFESPGADVRVPLESNVAATTWSPDDRLIGVTFPVRKTVGVYRSNTLELMMETPLLGSIPRSVAFSSNGMTMAIATDSATLLWDVPSNARKHTIAASGGRSVFNQNDSRILTANEHELVIHDLDPSSLTTLSGRAYLYRAAFSPDGSLLATGGLHGSVNVWDVLERRCVGTFVTSQPIILALSFTEDGRAVFARSRDVSFESVIDLWSVTSATMRETLPDVTSWRDYVRPGARGGTGNDGDVWQINRGGIRQAPGLGHEPEAFVVGQADSGLESTIPTFTSAAAISRDGRMIATAEPNEPTVVVWRLSNSKQVATLRAEPGDSIHGITFSPDMTRVIGAGRRGSIYCWDMRSGDLICVLREHQGNVHDVVFSDDGTRLASVSGSGTAKIFDSVLMERRSRELEAMRTRRAELQSKIDSWPVEVDVPDLVSRLDGDALLSSADRRFLFDHAVAGQPLPGDQEP